MINVTYSAAFLAGLLSFLSPCVLPLVPPYITFLTGTTLENLTERQNAEITRRAFLTSLLFVAGFSTVFVLLGATASAVGQIVRQYLDIFGMIAGFAIILMGLHFLGIFRLEVLYREARVQLDKPTGSWGAYVMGLAFAFGWTPCIGPVLAAILAIAGSEESITQGAGLLAVYSLGLGIPFIMTSFLMKPLVSLIKRLRTRFSLIEKIIGSLLIVTGFAFLTGSVNRLSFLILELFPFLGKIG